MNTSVDVIRWPGYDNWLQSAKIARDTAFEHEYEKRCAAEEAVITRFPDLLEVMAEEFTDVQGEVFMNALARATKADVMTIYCLLDQAKQRLVNRILAGG